MLSAISTGLHCHYHKLDGAPVTLTHANGHLGLFMHAAAASELGKGRLYSRILSVHFQEFYISLS